MVLAYVAALGELLDGTRYNDGLDEDPEVFVATGLLFCERLDNGVSPSEVLREYVAVSFDGDPEDAPGELLDLSGWILGVAVGVFCPDHTADLEDLNTP